MFQMVIKRLLYIKRGEGYPSNRNKAGRKLDLGSLKYFLKVVTTGLKLAKL